MEVASRVLPWVNPLSSAMEDFAFIISLMSISGLPLADGMLQVDLFLLFIWEPGREDPDPDAVDNALPGRFGGTKVASGASSSSSESEDGMCRRAEFGEKLEVVLAPRFE